MKKPEKEKRTKKEKLYLANQIGYICFIALFFIEWGFFGKWSNETLFIYIITLCAYTFMTLVVYFLSIIADALGNKNKTNTDSEDDNK